MTQAIQLPGEAIRYEQVVTGDTISSAAWTASPAGPTLSQADATATTASILFQSNSLGDFILECTLQMTSGQIRKGQIRVNVIPLKV